MNKHKIVIELEIEEDLSSVDVIKLFENLFSEGTEIDGVEVNITEINYITKGE